MRRKWSIGLGGLAVAAAGVMAWVNSTWLLKNYAGHINALKVDLSQPAAYLATPSLSALPKDLVKAPVLRELLTKDFAFYYEDHEDRLGLSGALRRIAFEHETSLSDQLLALALDEPAEVALWTDGKGAPRHWAVAMTRGTLAKALQGLATVASKDQQLTLVGQLKTAAWRLEGLPVYALQLSSRRTLAFISQGNRVVVLSDPGLLFSSDKEPDPKAAGVLSGLLSADGGAQAVWRHHFGLDEPSANQHRLVASGAMLSFGYQQFFPSLQALRVDVAKGGTALSSHVRRQEAGASDRLPWAALPAHAAACSVLPVDWAQTQAVLGEAAKRMAAPPTSGVKAAEPAERQAQAAALGQFTDAMDGTAAVCWYERSQMHTPLWVAHAKGAAPSAQQLKDFAAWLLPAAAELQPGPGLSVDARLTAPYGPLAGGDGPAYQLRLARAGDWWLFSPDAELVEQAQATLARRYPSLAETLSTPTQTQLVLAPTPLASLIQRETLAVITPQQASFRQAVETHLLPQLRNFAKLPASQAVLHGQPNAQGWQALSWHPLKAYAP